MKIIIYFLMAIVLNINLMSLANSSEIIDKIKYMPANGVVNNEKIAISISEIYLSNVYGFDKINKQKPFSVKLIDTNTWLVFGSFVSTNNKIKGGVVYIKIRKSDGAVLGMIHGK